MLVKVHKMPRPGMKLIKGKVIIRNTPIIFLNVNNVLIKHPLIFSNKTRLDKTKIEIFKLCPTA